jgi:hypothetical protein
LDEQQFEGRLFESGEGRRSRQIKDGVLWFRAALLLRSDPIEELEPPALEPPELDPLDAAIAVAAPSMSAASGQDARRSQTLTPTRTSPLHI